MGPILKGLAPSHRDLLPATFVTQLQVHVMAGPRGPGGRPPKSHLCNFCGGFVNGTTMFILCNECLFVHGKCSQHAPMFVTLFWQLSVSGHWEPRSPAVDLTVWLSEGPAQRAPASCVCLDVRGEVSGQGAECLAAVGVPVSGREARKGVLPPNWLAPQ